MSRAPRTSRRRGLALAVFGAAALAAIPAAQATAAPTEDGRAYELISGSLQVGRQASGLLPVGDPASGRLLFEIDQAQDDSDAYRLRSRRVATRSSSGWASNDVNIRSQQPPASSAGDDFGAMDPNVDHLVIFTDGRLDPASEQTFGLFDVGTGTRTARALGPGTFAGSSASTETVYFSSTDDLAPGAAALPDDVQKIYRRDADGVRLASVLPTGTTLTSTPEEPAVLAPVLEPRLVLDPFDAGRSGDGTRAAVGGGRRHPVSDDGRRLFFYAGSFSGSTDAYPLAPLYLRDGDVRTVAVSASRRTGEQGARRPARFIGASRDGDVSFFVASQPLTGGVAGAGIYRFQLSTKTLTRLTGNPGGAGFEALDLSSAWTSDDASTLYFVSSAVLANGAVAGTRNAYAWRDGQLRFVADLGSDGAVRRVSRDGTYAVFSSSSPVDGAPTGGQSQLFRFVRSTGDLQCASCRADGSANAGPSAIDIRPNDEANPAPPTTARGISDDGHVFFTAQDALVAQDPSGAEDVYEFTGTSLRLLSDGRGASFLADNSDDGSSVFMVTSSALLRQDIDGEEFDLYVRRTGGGFPQPGVPAACAGDGCQGAGAIAASPPAPGSDRVGAGNVVPNPRAGLRTRPSLSAAGRRALARGLRARVTFRVRGPGTVSVRISSQYAGKRRTVARASGLIRSSRVQTVSLRVRLSSAARKRLRRSGKLRVRLESRLSGAGSRTAAITLRKAGR